MALADGNRLKNFFTAVFFIMWIERFNLFGGTVHFRLTLQNSAFAIICIKPPHQRRDLFSKDLNRTSKYAR